MPFTATVVMLTVIVIACIEFDERLPEIIAAMRENDLLLITADHGMIQRMQEQTTLVNIFHCWPIALPLRGMV